MNKLKFTRLSKLYPSFSRLDETFDELDRIFDEASNILDGPYWHEVKHTLTKPAIDYHTKVEDGIHVLEVAVPGVNQEQVSVTVLEGKLHVKVETSNLLWTKATDRTFTLPEEADVEAIKAEVKDGLLTVKIPTLQPVKPKEVKIL